MESDEDTEGISSGHASVAINFKLPTSLDENYLDSVEEHCC